MENRAIGRDDVRRIARDAMVKRIDSLPNTTLFPEKLAEAKKQVERLKVANIPEEFWK